MDTMLSGFDFAVVHLDDILMKSQSFGKHKEHVNKFAESKIMGSNLKNLNETFSWKK